MSHGLKDKFAADAMAAMLSAPDLTFNDTRRFAGKVASIAYDVAEAMLAERARRYSAHSEKKEAAE